MESRFPWYHWGRFGFEASWKWSYWGLRVKELASPRIWGLTPIFRWTVVVGPLQIWRRIKPLA